MRTRPGKDFTLKDNVPKGPYLAKSEEWDAIEKLLALERLRAESSMPPFLKPDVAAHTGLSREYILKESAKAPFVEFALARSKRDVGAELAKMAPDVIAILKKMAETKENLEPKERKEFLNLYLSLMDVFNIKEIDMGKGVLEDDVNTDEVLEEALEAVRALAGKCQHCGKENDIPVQRFISKAVYGTKQAKEDKPGGVGKVKSHSQQDSQAEIDKGERSDTTLETVPLQHAPVEESKKISGDDNGESVVKIDLAGG